MDIQAQCEGQVHIQTWSPHIWVFQCCPHCLASVKQLLVYLNKRLNIGILGIKGTKNQQEPMNTCL